MRGHLLTIAAVFAVSLVCASCGPQPIELHDRDQTRLGQQRPPREQVMDQSLKEWFDEYGRLSDALRPYSDRITRKIFGPTAPQELTEPEHVFERLHYYWSAALVNAGDVFGYVPFIIENRAGFTAIGADGTLAALERLMPFYRQQEQLRDDAEKNEYWRRTREERASAEDLAEGVHEFARLLLAYAEKNLPPPNEK